jgi:type II secretory ATPase GspE/PulE/Tfp pilus assembly ATPase PilB-like protein
MVFFNDDDQQKKLAKFKKGEEEDLARQAASESDFPYINLTGISINTDALKIISEEVARSRELAAFDMVDKKLRLAVRAPDSKAVKKTLKQLREGGWKPQIFITSPSSLQKAYGYYDDINETEKSTAGKVDITPDAISEITRDDKSQSEIVAIVEETLAETKNTSRVIEVLAGAAIALGASDVHIEPGEKEYTLRMRIDGVLQKVTTIQEQSYKLILSRLKLLSGMKLNITNEAQDGRFSIRVDESQTEIRSSSVPSAYGESIVMRILNKETLDADIEHLGMQPHFLEVIQKEIRRPKGLILNTGPTGSGKTTTLYSFLKEVNEPGNKVITIENPIEYHLDGIVQTQANPDEAYDFYDGLKAAMRQDPDIIMVGEIRDADTAKTAMQAGLTGHRVLSTLHTNDAAGTFPRLVELGIDKNLIDDALNVAMAQRLIRRLCENCKEQIAIAGEEKGIINELTKNLPNKELYADTLAAEHIYQAGGCDECNNTGYKGRIAVFEAIVVDERVGELVRENPSSPQIWQHAQNEQGMLSMAQDGILKVLAGISDIAELQRVIDIEKSIRSMKA